MSAAARSVKGFSAQTSFLDFDVANIPEHWRRQHAQLTTDWLASTDFALGHLFPPAQRIWMKVDPAGTLRHGYYYDEKQLPLGKCLTVHGPAELDIAEARELLQARRAVRLDVARMNAPSFPNSLGKNTNSVSRFYGEDVVVELPASEEELLKSFGPNKRQQLGKYTRRVERQWPGSVEWVCLSKNEIDMQLFADIVRFNSQRQSAKGKQALWHDDLISQRLELVRRTGLLCGIRLGGEFVAGGVAYVYSQDAYYALIGHDPRYDYWNLGNLTTWLLMKKSLGLGVRRFHFLWGLSEYKFRFGGEIQPLYTITVHRNFLARLASSFLDTGPAWKNKVLRATRKVHMDLRNSQFGRFIFGLWPQQKSLRNPHPE